MRKRFVYIALTLASSVLAACSQPSAPAKVATRPVVDNQAAVAAIRAAGAQSDSSVEVKPLREPAVEGLLKQAREAESQGQIAAAIDATSRALAIAKDAPDILQYQAELYIEQADWKQAAMLAQRSYELGPKVGSLCARNQRTLAETRHALGDPDGAQQAQQQLSSCRVPAPARF